MKNNVLIFTASTGQGHNAAANALKKELESQGYDVHTIEPIKEASKSLDTIIADGYKVIATKLPKVYGALYKISNYETVSNRISKIFIKAVENKIYEITKQYEPSLVISTHPLLVNVISVLKKDDKINVPFISVVTDYQAHQSYINPYVDAYIAGSIYTKTSLVDKGINEDKIYTYGIPIRREFNDHPKLLNKDERFTILLMGGSMGVNGIKKALKNIMEVEYPLKVIVVCGSNETLKHTLEEKYSSIDNNKYVIILGFTNNVHELMDISDVIITKPGGLTSTEALTKRIPLIIPYYIPGQEKENTEILVESGAAISVDVKDLSEVIKRLIDNPSILDNMKNSIDNITKTHSLDSTIDLAITLIEEYNQNR